MIGIALLIGIKSFQLDNKSEESFAHLLSKLFLIKSNGGNTMRHSSTKKYVRRFLSLLPIAVLSCLLPACGGGGTDTTPTEPVSTQPVANINSDARDSGPTFSSDGLALYFHSDRAGGYGGFDIYVAKRANTADAWGQPQQLGLSINSSANDRGPSISTDGLKLMFSSDRDNPNIYDLYIATRASVDVGWGSAVNLGTKLNTADDEGGPSLSSDGLALYFHSDRPGGVGTSDIYMASRKVIGPWDSVTNLTTINSPAYDVAPEISRDGLTLYFHSNRANQTSFDIWVSKRTSKNDPWGVPTLMPEPINSSDIETGPAVSADNKIIYFGSERPGSKGRDIWQSGL